jgi:uncharacterized protein (UPF0332 family)
LSSERSIRDIVNYRIEEAEESLKDAGILFSSGGSFRSVINRSYYTMFYATLAVIAEGGAGRSKHSGVISIFDREYVKTKIFPKEMSKLLHKAFNLRQESDYREFNIITKEEAQTIMKGAEDFLTKVKSYLNV